MKSENVVFTIYCKNNTKLFYFKIFAHPLLTCRKMLVLSHWQLQIASLESHKWYHQKCEIWQKVKIGHYSIYGVQQLSEIKCFAIAYIPHILQPLKLNRSAGIPARFFEH